MPCTDLAGLALSESVLLPMVNVQFWIMGDEGEDVERQSPKEAVEGE